MKKYFNLLILPGILFSFACSNGSNAVETNTSPPVVKENSDNGIVGEWERIAVGDDKNDNGILDDSENRIKDRILGGFDYFRFYADGKCLFDKDMKFDGHYEVKMDKNRKAIFIYPSGLPAGLSEKERDENAHVFRIHSIETKQLVLKPAHLAGRMVVYKRI